jgi:hypothetical protein
MKKTLSLVLTIILGALAPTAEQIRQSLRASALWPPVFAPSLRPSRL